jgi:hypothetical protein
MRKILRLIAMSVGIVGFVAMVLGIVAGLVGGRPSQEAGRRTVNSASRH